MQVSTWPTSSGRKECRVPSIPTSRIYDYAIIRVKKSSQMFIIYIDLHVAKPKSKDPDYNKLP